MHRSRTCKKNPPKKDKTTGAQGQRCLMKEGGGIYLGFALQVPQYIFYFFLQVVPHSPSNPPIGVWVGGKEVLSGTTGKRRDIPKKTFPAVLRTGPTAAILHRPHVTASHLFPIPHLHVAFTVVYYSPFPLPTWPIRYEKCSITKNNKVARRREGYDQEHR